ncbi:MAG: dGTP triphosphohydrolase [Steroidobacteraceae bacterium]|nr:dGTP triphosphohydrolase [Steroidobacteraceae bacterium]MBM2854361.1 dGTP triphosphohydrolase [Steroidobacteraceae bacterium]
MRKGRDPDTGLAPYAALVATSRGRRHPEPPADYRSEFQRDRDRIVHSNAFRRLVYKTQVFINHEGDMYRTRLTHSLEVAQIGRSVANALALSEPLTEAICLAHDLGHTPFGHAGQDVLNECMREYGGFEHNLQSLRVVDELEERYAKFRGLNLTFETREGILKHCSLANARQIGDVGRRFIERLQPGLEAQVSDLADAIAYNNHDVDDGLRSGLVTIDDLCEVALFARHHALVSAAYAELPPRRMIHEIGRRMIHDVVSDLIEETMRRLGEAKPANIDAVRTMPRPLAAFSEAKAVEHADLKKFLRTRLYRHEHIEAQRSGAAHVLRGLFEAFLPDVTRMPAEHRDAARALEAVSGKAGRARAVADYVAGMTDRYAFQEHARLTGHSAV